MLNIDMSGIDTTEITPPGNYFVVCEYAELKDTKSGDGQYINCRFRVKEGPRAGDTIFTMFNVKNKNAQAVQIGLKQLKMYCEAAGIPTDKLTDVNHLLGKPVIAAVKNKEDDYGTKAVIVYFKKHTEQKTDHDKIPF